MNKEKGVVKRFEYIDHVNNRYKKGLTGVKPLYHSYSLSTNVDLLKSR